MRCSALLILALTTAPACSEGRREPAGAATPRPAIIRVPDETPVHRDIGCGSLRFLVDGEDTGGAFAIVEGEECGRVTALHRHLHMDETFYVLEGTLTIYVDGQIRQLPAGSSITIPKGTPHAQGAPGDARVRVLTTFVPAGFEGALRERPRSWPAALHGIRRSFSGGWMKSGPGTTSSGWETRRSTSLTEGERGDRTYVRRIRASGPDLVCKGRGLENATEDQDAVGRWR